MIGKLDPDDLAQVLDRFGADDDAVAMGPEYGEDAAAIRLDDRLLVVSSDPLSLARERLGTLAVHVACNDVAVSGADPRWLTNVVFLPDDDPETLDALTEQIDAAAESLGVSVVGGHSEYAPALDRPMVSMTAFGTTEEYVPTGGAEPGDEVILTGGAGIEGTAVLATDFRNELDRSDDPRLSDDVLDRAESFFEEISVAPEAEILADYATAMHDPTEGGVLSGLAEMAAAAEVRIDVERNSVPVREETAVLCEAMDVDPLRIFGSGAVLATVPKGESDGVMAALEDAGVEASRIGAVEKSDDPGVWLGDEAIRESVRDDLYDLWE